MTDPTKAPEPTADEAQAKELFESLREEYLTTAAQHGLPTIFGTWESIGPTWRAAWTRASSKVLAQARAEERERAEERMEAKLKRPCPNCMGVVRFLHDPYCPERVGAG